MSIVENHFDAPIAQTYDADLPEMFAPAAIGPVVDVLARLAGNGRALELAVGTGRIALPLAARGVRVSGIDLSAAMLARLHAKPGAADVETTLGDMTCTRVEGTFSVVYLAFNTIMNVTTQEGQVAVFENAAAHLVPGGCFVVEVMVPALQRLAADERLHAFSLADDHIGVDEYDLANQRVTSHHVTTREGVTERAALPCRYVWPAELDLMARIAGMTLRSRDADWTGAPFTSESSSHVSIWQRPA